MDIKKKLNSKIGSGKKSDFLLDDILTSLNKVDDNPRSMILITNGFIELMVNVFIGNKAKDPDNWINRPHGTKLTFLYEMNVIPESKYILLKWFNNMRNKAAHEPLFELTEKELAEISPDKFKEIKNFKELCQDIIGGVWNIEGALQAKYFVD